MNESSKGQIAGGEGLSVRPGMLDGVTIMRYAHVDRQRMSGGVEQYLRHLHRGLLQRHSITVLQMHLMRDGAGDAIESERVGIGRVLWVPIGFQQTNSTLADLPRRIGYVYAQTLRSCQQEERGRYCAMLSAVGGLFHHHGGHLRNRTAVVSDRLADLLVTHNVDLLAMHWLTYDTRALIGRALKAGVPFVLINHFDNARLSQPGTREWTSRAAGIGTVSGQGVPGDLRDRCVNLSDAVDTEFFTPEKARPARYPARPLVLLPARIQTGKGHQDLIQAAHILMTRKVDCVIGLAGAVDSGSLYQDLRQSAVAMGLEGRVLFVGERSAEEIRDWYAASGVIVLPSYSEGLPRVLLEAQAMKRPIVAYDCDGMREAVLPNETGFLVSRGDVEALADKIRFLLENEAEGLRMGERGREFVSRHFSVPALIGRHEMFYLRALSGARDKGLHRLPPYTWRSGRGQG